MNRDFIAKYWYADVYEQFEGQQKNDVDYLLELLKKHTVSPQNILEIACGGGRMTIPLAETGHNVTGFDQDEYMLLQCCRKMKGFGNVCIFKADATEPDLPGGFDVVVMAGNVLINIESDKDYKKAQIAFIQNAAAAVREGGHLYIDVQMLYDNARFFNSLKQSSYFEGTDDMGTYGKTVSYGGTYDPVTQMTSGVSHWELKTNSGEELIISNVWQKHIPTIKQVYSWLDDAGMVVEAAYKNFSFEPISVPIDERTFRASIWARKL